MNAPFYGWRGEGSLAEWLRDEPYRFDFYQAVRLLEALYSIPQGTQESETVPAVRFRSRVSFAFPASAVHGIATPPKGAEMLPEMTVNFLGLAGALGPLPHAYTQMVLEAASRRDFAATDFLDIFNHRLVGLLYRARKAHHPALTVHAPSRGLIAQYLFSLIGLGQKSLRGRLGIPDSSLLHYSGLLSRNVRTAAGLECVVADYFGIAARVQQFAGRWRELDEGQCTVVGLLGCNQTLADGAVMGRRVWDQAGGVILILGPVSQKLLTSFLPRQPANRLLAELARFYLGVTYRIQFRLHLQASDMPMATLGSTQLGYTSWIGSGEHRGAGAAVQFFEKD